MVYSSDDYEPGTTATITCNDGFVFTEAAEDTATEVPTTTTTTTTTTSTTTTTPTTTTTTTTTFVARDCGDLADWTSYRGACFKYVSEQKNFREANSSCQTAKGGHLAIPKDYDLNVFISGLTNRRSWIGAWAENGVWKWRDGTPWEFSDWSDGEPNEDACLTANKDSDSTGWGDKGCNSNMPRICQVGATSPSPTSGTIQSGGFPDNYKRHQHHTFKLVAPAGKVIHLVWVEFEIENAVSGRCYDYVKVTDKDGTVLMDKTCQIGLPDPPELTSTSNEINIEFKADGSDQEKGYKADWSSIDPAGRKKRSAPQKEGIYVDMKGHSVQNKGKSSLAGSANRQRRQTVDLVKTRELECAEWHGGSGGYWKYDKKIPRACYSKG